jgi:hypothetical protein
MSLEQENIVYDPTVVHQQLPLMQHLQCVCESSAQTFVHAFHVQYLQ